MHEELEEIAKEAEAADAEDNMTMLQVIKAKNIRYQLISINLMMLCQQLSGMSHYYD